MKTTLEIPDALFRQAKSAAAEQGIPPRALVSEALAEKLRVRGSKDDVRRFLCGRLNLWCRSGTRRRPISRSTAYPFDDAAAVFFDPLALTFPDPDHSGGEEREITIGQTAGHRIVFVSHGQRGNRLRIISARWATRRERSQYEEGIGEEIG
jgi:uncharacterized DUF497 family protein